MFSKIEFGVADDRISSGVSGVAGVMVLFDVVAGGDVMVPLDVDVSVEPKDGVVVIVGVGATVGVGT